MAGKVVVGTNSSYETKEMICQTLDKLRRDDWLYSGGKLYEAFDNNKSSSHLQEHNDITIAELKAFVGKTTDEIPYETTDVELWGEKNYLETVTTVILYNHEGSI